MKQLDAGSDKSIIDTKPLFSSVWLALYNELRKNHTERQLAGNAVAGKPKAFPNKQSG